MNENIELWDRLPADEVYLIAGWSQWADAGNISTGLPAYLIEHLKACLLYTSPSPRDRTRSRMPSSA